MKRRILGGGYGHVVSEVALGAMMFGARAMGNTDHDESVAMIHAALDPPGSTSCDTAERVDPAASRKEIVGQGPQGPRRAEVVLRRVR